MRIGVYKDNLSTGRGADRAVRNFAFGLSERGHEVVLFEKPELSDRLNEFYDVVVATGSNEAVDLDREGFFRRKRRAKSVLQLHLAPRGFFKWKHPIRNLAIKRAFDKFELVQVLCADYKSEFQAFAPRPKVEVIGNWSEVMPSGFGNAPEKKNVILYPAAVLNKVKNQKLLIRSFALLADAFPEWKVRLLGKDTTAYAAECSRLILALHMEGRIDIVGFTQDLAREYSQAGFVAFPSVLEGFPLAILEASQFGLCSVAQKKLPGVRDIIRDGETGLVADCQVEAFAKALARLMADGNLRRSLGANAEQYCRTYYSRQKILDDWERLFSAL